MTFGSVLRVDGGWRADDEKQRPTVHHPSWCLKFSTCYRCEQACFVRLRHTGLRVELVAGSVKLEKSQTKKLVKIIFFNNCGVNVNLRWSAERELAGRMGYQELWTISKASLDDASLIRGGFHWPVGSSAAAPARWLWTRFTWPQKMRSVRDVMWIWQGFARAWDCISSWPPGKIFSAVL